MSKHNPLSGLIGQYGDSEEDSDEDTSKDIKAKIAEAKPEAPSSVHPAPVTHCPWSACYDEASGFTYYWNQYTNAVTWEAPPEYLLALKLAQQQLSASGSSEVSAEEWQMYQQALADKQNKGAGKPPILPRAQESKAGAKVHGKALNGKKRGANSDSEDDKIELITSYYNSDSESDTETPKKSVSPKKPTAPLPPPITPKPSTKVAKPSTKVTKPSTKITKPAQKKQKTKQTVEFGPDLPPNQNYSMPIGPELPPELTPAASPEVKEVEPSKSEVETKIQATDSDDEIALLEKLKDKAKLLEKLGGELPAEIQSMISDEANGVSSPKSTSDKINSLDTNIDDLLEEIEKKELPKLNKNKAKIDIFDDNNKDSGSGKSTPKEISRSNTPSRDEVKTLFPSSKSIVENTPPSLFPSAVNIDEKEVEPKPTISPEVVSEKKGANIYLMDTNDADTTTKKKLRISNSVLPDKKKELPEYTTKYSQVIDGFSGEKTGLGFNANENDETDKEKKPFVYGKGLVFTKGETLHEEKADELDDTFDLLETKLKFLNAQQVYAVSPLQEMTIQLQALSTAYKVKALTLTYMTRWLTAANESISKLEEAAAPTGWKCRFNRSEGHYEYVRESDGFTQVEFPACEDDMDICTTPPHPGIEEKPPPPAPLTPPPPRWDPPPPGVVDGAQEAPKEIGDELQSFYKDLAELDTKTSSSNSPEHASIPVTASVTTSVITSVTTSVITPVEPEPPKQDKCDTKVVKKKSKVKLSSSLGLKHKTVSNLVAKWQQVADEINSD